ncbi:MAG: type II toxin-antitoxin system CcdA family antitoxin [Burkholderiaceae bacterium]|nr:type II toxin-antitoxin system CcdA family antitoxin [Burkholderiaceae bacterium]
MALKSKIEELQARRWLKENLESIAAYNETVAEGGVFSDDLRRF